MAIPRLTRTWSTAISSEFSTTMTAETDRGASVCSATHSGSPLDIIAQHNARIPISAASVT